MEFEKRYKALNTEQKRAVDTIDGPVMVVAGPGTGKTELLAVRVANILKRTDALPQNILCLTFTESGAMAMRERLAGLIGPEAYKVAVHTFHSFGSEIINQNSEYFYNGAHFRPADELSAYEVLYKLFEKLPHDNPLASTMNGEYVALRQTQSTLSHLKRSGLTPDELNEVLARNRAFIDWVQPQADAVFNATISKKMFPAIDALITALDDYKEDSYALVTYEPLHVLFRDSLAHAYHTAVADTTTKPLTAWKRDWCEKRSDGSLTLKDDKRSKRLSAVSGIYYEYLVAMQERGMYDFDDMILRTVHALEVFDELRLNLQEQYQYLLIDEFQDTNDAQMRIVWNLTNNPASEGRPNIMVVGDDDQAIYRFQGANLSNILDFSHRYADVTHITLTHNYRSVSDILQLARRTIVQADERLENTHPDINKQLVAHHHCAHTELLLTSYTDQSSEYAALATRIALDIETPPKATYAVIGRTHQQLRELVPFLQAAHIPLHYEQRENILDLPPLQTLELLARTVYHIARQELRDAEALLPELLSHPMWSIDLKDIWRLSLYTQQKKLSWLEAVMEQPRPTRLADVVQWLVRMAYYSLHQPLEPVVDILSGVQNDDEFASPFKDYYFDASLVDTDAATYVHYLSGLTTLRERLRDYRPHSLLRLTDFIEFISQHRALGIPLQQTNTVSPKGMVVELLSAHKAKGLEYDTVYVVGLSDHVWGESARSGRSVSYPHNLQIGIGGDTADERIRLLFVALTRAKNHLILSMHRKTNSGKDTLPVAYLSNEHIDENTLRADSIEVTETLWHERLLPQQATDIGALLADTLKHYKLSPTHVGSYLDVSRGGPAHFLFQHLLRFPQAMSPSAAFGSAIHETMRSAHVALAAKGQKRPVEDLLGDFDRALQNYQLSHEDYEKLTWRGSQVLTNYFAKRYDSFSVSQISERSFVSDNIVLNDARITGVIDRIDLDTAAKTITVTDYKTGKPVPTWRGRTDYERIKLHHYQQQLMFYKLLIENSRQFSGYTVTKGYIDFVEPDEQDNLHRLELDYNDAELDEFTRLIGRVWQHIQALDYESSDQYSADYKGIRQFETDLLDKKC